ncbi:MAG TPA: hypothetical protein VF282_10035 [Bacillota bacterium]
MPRRVGLVVFEGGLPEPIDADEAMMRAARRAMAADLLEQARAADSFDSITLCSDDPVLLQEAGALGCRTVDTRAGFHLQATLAEVVERQGLEAVICMGGTACPLATAADLAEWAGLIRTQDRVVLVNNPMSPDIVAVHPAGLIGRLDPPPVLDNQLGESLRRAGLRRVLLPPGPRWSLDVDTPADVLILAVLGAGGPRARAVLEQLPWDRARVTAVLELLRRGRGELLLIGRVPPGVVAYLNAHFKIRVRVISEERGMKALGLDGSGTVRSLVGAWIEDVGVERFLQQASATADAVLFDTRPVLAHRGRRVSDRDRFRCDLGRWPEICDPLARDLARCAGACGVPVVLGGHTLVHGGLWALAAHVVGGRSPGGVCDNLLQYRQEPLYSRANKV